MAMTGKKLRKVREGLELTIEEFAQMLGYSWSQMQRMEKGRRKVSKRVLIILQEKGLA